jgi:hypothetical protein
LCAHVMRPILHGPETCNPSRSAAADHSCRRVKT